MRKNRAAGWHQNQVIIYCLFYSIFNAKEDVCVRLYVCGEGWGCVRDVAKGVSLKKFGNHCIRGLNSMYSFVP